MTASDEADRGSDKSAKPGTDIPTGLAAKAMEAADRARPARLSLRRAIRLSPRIPGEECAPTPGSARDTKETHWADLQGAELATPLLYINRGPNAAIAEIQHLRADIAVTNTRKAAWTIERRAGDHFEDMQARTFNAAARRAGDFTTTAETGRAGGFANDPRVDIRVSGGSKPAVEFQAKCYGSSQKTAAQVAKPQYEGLERLVPADQLPDVRSTLEKSARGKLARGDLAKAANRQEAAGLLTDRIKIGKTESKPATLEKARRAAAGNTRAISRAIAFERCRAQIIGGFKGGARVSGAISIMVHTGKVASGEVSGTQAVRAVAVDTVRGGLRGSVTALVSDGLKAVAERALGSEAAAIFVKGAAPLAAAGCLVEIGLDVYHGKVSVKRVARAVTRAAGGYAGAEAGAALGTMIFPGAGTVLGAIAGGVAGSAAGSVW